MSREDLSACRNIDCPRNAECERYIERDNQNYDVRQFENICFERNNYKYFERKY